MDSAMREGWAEWALGMAFIGLRIYARCRTIGWRWQGDDYLVILSGACFTGVFVTTIIERSRGSNVGLTDEQRAALTPEQIKPMEEGSKAILAALYIYATGLWSMKAQVLFLYRRLTLGLWQQKLVKWAALICAVFYLAIILVVTCRCLPLRKTWQVYPDPGESCTTSIAYYLTTELSNQVTDLMLFTIPLPLVLKVNISLPRKFLIGALLGSGLFVFVVSIIRLVLTLGDIRHMSTLAIWAIREMFVAVLCVNATSVKPLFSSSRWVHTTGNSYDAKKTPRSGSGRIELHSSPKDKYPITSMSPHGSDENIISHNISSTSGKPTSEGSRLEIQRTTDVEVSRWDAVSQTEHVDKW